MITVSIPKETPSAIRCGPVALIVRTPEYRSIENMASSCGLSSKGVHTKWYYNTP